VWGVVIFRNQKERREIGFVFKVSKDKILQNIFKKRLVFEKCDGNHV
jgi:hypothetical protein